MEEQTIREQLRAWRREHPHATFDEIDAEVARQYAQLHAQVVAELSGAGGRDEGAEADVVGCPACQAPMQRRGQRTRQVLTRRGVAAELVREYYACPACGTGVFPPR